MATKTATTTATSTAQPVTYKPVKAGLKDLPDQYSSTGTIAAITPENLTKFIETGSKDYMIIDLRCDKDFTEVADRFCIKGAKHLPLSEGSGGPRALPFHSLCVRSISTDRAKATVKNNWAKLLKKTGNLAFLKDSLDKKYVIFHCAFSSNRTPVVAAGYDQYAKKAGQQVIVLEGGWIAYKDSKGALVEAYKGEKPLGGGEVTLGSKPMQPGGDAAGDGADAEPQDVDF